MLFVSMARQVGLDARFREVEVAPTWSKNGMFVNLNEHVNAAVFIEGAPYSIDVFPAVNRIELGGRVVSDARGLAHFYNNRGVEALGAGNLDDGEAYLRKALEVDPTMVPGWINLGASESKRGLLSSAEGHYRRALQLDPQNQTAMGNLAIVCELTGRTKEAARYQAKVRAFREKNPYHHYNLGLQAFEEGRYEDAVACYKKALKLKAPEHNFHFALAKAYGQLGRTEDMADSLRKAMKYANDEANRTRYSQKLELLKSLRHGAASVSPR
jgi:Flp pilus assembly protein TadD